eukprot:365704-Chlamydomonas_euryale.AAC.8
MPNHLVPLLHRRWELPRNISLFVLCCRSNPTRMLTCCEKHRSLSHFYACVAKAVLFKLFKSAATRAGGAVPHRQRTGPPCAADMPRRGRTVCADLAAWPLLAASAHVSSLQTGHICWHWHHLHAVTSPADPLTASGT